jgi:hypothetical protein
VWRQKGLHPGSAWLSTFHGQLSQAIAVPETTAGHFRDMMPKATLFSSQQNSDNHKPVNKETVERGISREKAR